MLTIVLQITIYLTLYSNFGTRMAGNAVLQVQKPDFQFFPAQVVAGRVGDGNNPVTGNEQGQGIAGADLPYSPRRAK